MQAYNVSIVTGPDQVDPYVIHDLFVKAIRESLYHDALDVDEELLKGAALHYTTGDLETTCLILLHCDSEIVGFLCGEVGYMTRYFQQQPIASETLWWIAPEHRGKSGSRPEEMIHMFETWGKYNDCKVVTLSNQLNEYTEKVAGFYKYLGYTKLEETFLKNLGD